MTTTTATTITRVLFGHDSEATAFTVDDYPYGFRLRCKIRYWIETSPKNGQRLVSQTTNPKIARPAGSEVWNKPKKSTYSNVIALFLDGEGHVSHDGLTAWADEPRIDAFVAAYGEALTSKHAVDSIKVLRAMARAGKKITWQVGPVTADAPRQSREEQRDLIRGVVGAELRRMG